MGTTETELSLRHNAELERERMGNTLEAIGDRLSPERVVERRKAAVGQGFKRMREAVMGSPEYIEPAAERARETAHDMSDKVQHAPDAIAAQTRGNPVAVGLIAFGTGLLAATLFPKTRTEQRIVGAAQPALDTAKQELRDSGRQVADRATEEAKRGARDIGAASKEAASHVADEARSSAQGVSDQARR